MGHERIAVVTSRRDLLRLALGAGLATVGVPGGARTDDPGRTTTTPSTRGASTSGSLAPPEPVRTVTPDAPARQVVAMSSADLDGLHALDHAPTAAWAAERWRWRLL